MQTYCRLLRLSCRRSCGVARGSWLVESVERVWLVTLGKYLHVQVWQLLETKEAGICLLDFCSLRLSPIACALMWPIRGSYGAVVEMNRWWRLCRWIRCDVSYVFVHLCNGLVTLFWSRPGDVARIFGELRNQIVSLMCLNDFSFSCGWFYVTHLYYAHVHLH